ncbi:MAG: histidine kinase [Gammaproteobacteria bacterium]|nr:histidine kinase [Gammaproteobacteria bacterium]
MTSANNAFTAPGEHGAGHGPPSFLPDFCGTRMVFVVVLLAELLVIALTLARSHSSTEELFDIALFSFYAQWMALSCLGALCLAQRLLRRLPELWVAGGSYAVVLLVTMIVAELAWQIAVRWIPPTPIPDTHALFLLRSMGISGISWALALRYFYVRHQWRRRIESEADARFQALQSRIRPHFLFNCMNTIASLTHQRPDLAEQSIEDLSDLIRASLRDAGEATTLGDEITLCKQYLRIEQHRLGERLRVEWSGLDAVPDLRLPPLTLQPLLENAIYHGIEPLTGGGTIRISRDAARPELTIHIDNPRPAENTRAGWHEGNRLAQENVAQRLSAFFGRAGLLAIHSGPGDYRVSLTIPSRHEIPDR